MKKFYYVYNRAQEKPLHRHKTKKEAVEEAKRLTKLLNKNFYVLTPVVHIISDHENGLKTIETNNLFTMILTKITNLFKKRK